MNEEALDRIINEWTINLDYYDAMKKLQKAGVAAAPSLSSEALFQDPHLKEREVFRQVDHPVIGKDWVIGPPWKLSGTPAILRSPAPLLGEHTDEIFQNHLGMSPEEIQALKEEQVIY